MKKKGICRLCGQEKELIKSSHIIPAFMYGPLFDVNRQMYLRSLTKPEGNGKLVQTGIFEKHILCEECDTLRLGQLDRYGAAVLFNEPIPPLQYKGSQNPDGSHSIKLTGIDYGKFKLFLLSLVWRAHISTNKFFEKVHVRTNEAALREMLLSRDAGKEGRFRIAAMAVKGTSGDLVRLVLNPEVQQLGNGSFATFFINGFIYFIDLEPASDFALFNNFYLREDGNLEIPLLQNKRANDILRGLGVAPVMADFFTG